VAVGVDFRIRPATSCPVQQRNSLRLITFPPTDGLKWRKKTKKRRRRLCQPFNQRLASSVPSFVALWKRSLLD